MLYPPSSLRLNEVPPFFLVGRDKGQLTVGKVNVFGDLVPGPVVKVADLLLVLHHVGWLASFLVLHCNVVLDSLKILPMLNIQVDEMMPKDTKTYKRHFN